MVSRALPRAVSLSLVAALGLSACSGGTDYGGGGGSGSSGKTLRVAADVEPGVLDWQQGTAGSTQLAGIQVFETLYAVDGKYSPVPMLASAAPKVSDDGLTYTIPLRDDVKFQNGSTMKADDVVASLDRWGKVSGIGQAMYASVEDVSAPADDEVKVELKQRYDVTRTLAVPIAAAVVMPKSIVDEYGSKVIGDVKDLVGTGPYRFTEWSKGKKYVLEKFADYSAVTGDAGGLAGKKEATYETIEVSFVTDPNTRLTSTSSGQYDMAMAVPADLYKKVESQGLEAQVTQPFYSQYLLLNTSKAPFDDVDVRRAAALALDPKTVAESAYGDPSLYEMSGSLYPDGMGVLSSKAGTGAYGKRNLAAAKALLKKSGYDGQTLTFMTVQTEPNFYNATVSAAQQLEQAGFTVKIDVTDGAAMRTRYEKPKTWDLFSTAFGIGYILPSSHLLLSGYFPFDGWYAKNGPAAKSLREWQTATTDAQRRKIMADIQTQFYRDQPAVKLADYAGLNGVSSKVDVGAMSFYWPTWWNAKAR